jgi:hypothetical protein
MYGGVPLYTRKLFRCSVLLRDLDHGGFYGFKNLEISGATAKDSGERRANLIACGMGMLVQQGFRGDQNRGGAVAALRRAEIGEGVLQWMEMAFQAQPFDSQDGSGVAFNTEDQAGEHGFAVEKNGASAALTEFAAVFRAGVAEIFPKEFEQSFIRGEGNVNLFAIERHAKVRSFLGFGRKRNQNKSPLGKSSGGRMQIRAARQELADGAPHFCGGRRASERIGFGEQPANQIVGEAFGDFGGGQSAVGMKPADAPVEGSEDGARGESVIARHEFTGASPSGDQVAHTLFVTIAFYTKSLLQAREKSAGQEMGGGTFYFVEHAAQMRNYDQAQFFRGAGFRSANLLKSGDQAIESDVLTEKQNFVLALEIIVEVGGREVGRGSDVAHTGFGEAGDAKLFSGSAKDFQAAGDIAPG